MQCVEAQNRIKQFCLKLEQFYFMFCFLLKIYHFLCYYSIFMFLKIFTWIFFKIHNFILKKFFLKMYYLCISFLYIFFAKLFFRPNMFTVFLCYIPSGLRRSYSIPVTSTLSPLFAVLLRGRRIRKSSLQGIRNQVSAKTLSVNNYKPYLDESLG